MESIEQTIRREARADAEYVKEATNLSRMLLKPVAEHLGNKRLLIVAEGALQYIPFGALPKPVDVKETTPAKQQATDYRPLIVDHEIVTLPSASVLAVVRNEVAGRKPAPKTVAVLADPVFQKHDARFRVKRNEPENTSVGSSTKSEGGVFLDDPLTRSTRQLGINRLRRLAWTGFEADAIVKLAQGKEYLKAVGFDANTNSGGKRRIIRSTRETGSALEGRPIIAQGQRSAALGTTASQWSEPRRGDRTIHGTRSHSRHLMDELV